MKELFLRIALPAVFLAALALALPGCDRIINPILDQIVPGWRDEPAAVRPDSVRGDTTFYSYQFQAPSVFGPGWVSGEYPPANGDVVIARIDGDRWILPFFFYPLWYPREDMDFPNHIRLICRTVDGETTEEIRARARAAIERGGAEIAWHAPPDSSVSGVDEPVPRAEFFDVYHPTAELGSSIPADVKLMRFLRELDDSEAFEFVFPYLEWWAEVW